LCTQAVDTLDAAPTPRDAPVSARIAPC